MSAIIIFAVWRRSSAGQSIRFIPGVSCVRITSPLPPKTVQCRYVLHSFFILISQNHSHFLFIKILSLPARPSPPAAVHKTCTKRPFWPYRFSGFFLVFLNYPASISPICSAATRSCIPSECTYRIVVCTSLCPIIACVTLMEVPLCASIVAYV